MLALLLAVVTATAAPSPSPTTEPLKTIVTVKSTTFCQQYANHSNAAIGSAISNDQSLGSTILTLRSTDLASGELTRNREIHRLQDLADAIYHQYRLGEDEVNHLRELAKSAQDEETKKDIKDAADALGGVLYRQHLIQRDLDGFVSYLYAADMMVDLNNADTRAELTNGASIPEYGYNNYGDLHSRDMTAPGGLGAPSGLPFADATPQDDVHMAANASHDFEQRLPAVFKDEMTAADRLTAANTRC